MQQQSKMNQGRAHFPFWWLPPLKDLLDAALWAGAFSGNQITWRGERYRILPGGKLAKLAEKA
jgi:hypothetical protein